MHDVFSNCEFHYSPPVHYSDSATDTFRYSEVMRDKNKSQVFLRIEV